MDACMFQDGTKYVKVLPLGQKDCSETFQLRLTSCLLAPHPNTAAHADQQQGYCP